MDTHSQNHNGEKSIASHTTVNVVALRSRERRPRPQPAEQPRDDDDTPGPTAA